MFPWERPAFGSAFELWREGGVVHLVLAEGARIGPRGMKELARLTAAMDPGAQAPVLVECREGVRMDEAACGMLRRVALRAGGGNPVALFTHDTDLRLQCEFFKRTLRPAFPFRVFGWRDEACRWVRERRQLAELAPRRKAG